METAEYDYTMFHKPRAGDEKLAIRFFIKAKQDGELSQKEGRPIFKDHEYIQIMIPGDRGHVLVRPVQDQDRGRFAQQYAHWKKTNDNELGAGTPLEHLGLSLSQVEEFRYFGIRTIEHMANIRDDLAAKIPGTQGLKTKAQAYLEVLKEEAPMKKVRAELEKRDAEMETLRTALADQAKIIKELRKKAGLPEVEAPAEPQPEVAAKPAKAARKKAPAKPTVS